MKLGKFLAIAGVGAIAGIAIYEYQKQKKAESIEEEYIGIIKADGELADPERENFTSVEEFAQKHPEEAAFLKEALTKATETFSAVKKVVKNKASEKAEEAAVMAEIVKEEVADKIEDAKEDIAEAKAELLEEIEEAKKEIAEEKAAKKAE